MTLGKLNNFRHCEQSEAIQNVLRWYRISEAPPQGTDGMGHRDPNEPFPAGLLRWRSQ